ncbi:MAG: helix-hairpin-helix domain-containing protein, partial [Legionella sp.]
FATNNLRISLVEYSAKHTTIVQRYKALEEVLSLPHPIQRMECFDISHTQGEATIASCVVFDNHGPATNEYRRFNIEGITPGDDYAAMEQAITRRFKRLKEIQSLPDVLIIDGGKGQVAIAKKVLAALDITGLTLLGVAKGPARKAGWEKLILAYEQQEFTLPEDAKALHLLQHIRDEAHRFAITAHRKKRQKARTDSSLEEIEGVGAKRRQALLHRFGGLRELAKAPVEEIAKVSGISINLAQKIYKHFHPDF